jgi:hypothetical protein
MADDPTYLDDLARHQAAVIERCKATGYPYLRALGDALELWLAAEQADDEYRATGEGSHVCRPFPVEVTHG